MTRYKVLHARDDTDRHVTEKGGMGLISIEDGLAATIQNSKNIKNE